MEHGIGHVGIGAAEAAASVGRTLSAVSERVVVEVEKMVAGGLALGHAPSGQVVLATGGLPGERVEVRIDTQRKRLLQGVVTEVHEPSDQRRSEPCPEVSRGCGGCDLQHVTPAAQRDIKVSIVRDALARLARLTDVEVTPGIELGSERYRTTLRCGVVDGRLGFRSHHSHDIHGVDDCLVAHDAVAEIVRDGRFGAATEVVIRAGARTGERMVVVSPTADAVSVPPDVVVVGSDELDTGHRAWIHEEVGGHRFRISARSFFQARPDGGDALVDAVGRAIGPLSSTDRFVDLYGGVGLFSAAFGAVSPLVVERSASAVADARVNLDGIGATLVRVAVERWRPSRADVVVADPARAGLGADGVRALAATGAARVAIVSCDPASLARDVRLIVDSGYEVQNVELVDLFPNTHHIEAVTSLVRIN